MNLPEHTIVRKRGLGSEYDGGSLHASPVMNFPEWHGWSRQYYPPLAPIETTMIHSLLSDDNRKAFRGLFGKPSFTYRGSHYHHCWYIRLPHVDLLVLTAREHGTSWEAVVSSGGKKIRKDIPEALAFMDSVKEALVEWYGDSPPWKRT